MKPIEDELFSSNVYSFKNSFKIIVGRNGSRFIVCLKWIIDISLIFQTKWNKKWNNYHISLKATGKKTSDKHIPVKHVV